MINASTEGELSASRLRRFSYSSDIGDIEDSIPTSSCVSRQSYSRYRFCSDSLLYIDLQQQQQQQQQPQQPQQQHHQVEQVRLPVHSDGNVFDDDDFSVPSQQEQQPISGSKVWHMPYVSFARLMRDRRHRANTWCANNNEVEDNGAFSAAAQSRKRSESESPLCRSKTASPAAAAAAASAASDPSENPSDGQSSLADLPELFDIEEQGLPIPALVQRQSSVPLTFEEEQERLFSYGHSSPPPATTASGGSSQQQQLMQGHNEYQTGMLQPDNTDSGTLELPTPTGPFFYKSSSTRSLPHHHNYDNLSQNQKMLLMTRAILFPPAAPSQSRLYNTTANDAAVCCGEERQRGCQTYLFSVFVGFAVFVMFGSFVMVSVWWAS